MPCSLDKLVETLTDSEFKFPYMNAIFGENAKMLTRKGVFPYDWYNSQDKDLCTSLPSKEKFFSKLSTLHKKIICLLNQYGIKWDANN